MKNDVFMEKNVALLEREKLSEQNEKDMALFDNEKVNKKIPRHIAIIMDGNGRWAVRKNRPRIFGHREGAKTVRKITSLCARLSVEQLTLYAFSSQNWERPENEVNYVFTLLRRFLAQERDTIMKNNIRFKAIGRIETLPKIIQKELEATINMSKENTGMILCLALSYSGRNEILDATKALVQKALAGEISVEDINEETFAQNLYQPAMPDPDLLIRTGGDMRVSNFLLWQISYSELWVTPVLWPDFQEEHLYAAIENFSQRDRRFGKLNPIPSI